MPKVKKVTGTSHDVVKIAFDNRYKPLPSRRANGKIRDMIKEMISTSPYRANLSQTLLDLNRANFFPSNGKTVDDFVRDWVNAPSTDFAQGNLTAASYQLLLSLLMVNQEIFCKDGAEGDRAQRYEAYFRSMRRIDFGYYNDEGILCGVSITYSTEDPSLWIASSTRNTPGKDQDRPTFFLSSEEIVDDDKGESIESSDAAPEFLAFLKSAAVKDMFEGVFLADGLVSLEKLEELQELTDKVAPINAGKTKTFQTRKALLDKLEKDRQDVIAVNPALEQASQQSFVRRNAGSLFLGFFAFMTLVNLVLIATGVLAPLGFILEGVKDYLALGVGAVAVGVASATNLSRNEHQLSTYQESISEETFETNARAAFIALDKKEAEEALREKQEQEPKIILIEQHEQDQKIILVEQHEQDQKTILVEQLEQSEKAFNHTDEEEFDVVGGYITEVVRDDSSLSKAAILVESLSDQPLVTSPQKGLGVTIPQDGVVIPTDGATPTYG